MALGLWQEWHIMQDHVLKRNAHITSQEAEILRNMVPQSLPRSPFEGKFPMTEGPPTKPNLLDVHRRSQYHHSGNQEHDPKGSYIHISTFNLLPPAIS